MLIMMGEDLKLSSEEFLDTASEKIIQALSNSQGANKHKWAVNFLQKAVRGFGDVNHEPWIGPLTMKECTEVVLQNYKQFLRNSDLENTYLNTMLRTVVRSTLNVNDFISELVTVIVDEKSVSCENVIKSVLSQKEMIGLETKYRGLPVSVKTNVNVGSCSSKNPMKRSLRTEMEISGEKSCVKRSSRLVNSQKESINEVKDLLNDIWSWVKAGRVQLSADIVGKLLSSLPEKVEELMIDIAFEVIKNSVSRKKLVWGVEEEFGSNSSTTSINNEGYVVDSILQDNTMIIGAAKTSPKLFQLCSSVLNQILIHSSGSSDAWPAMLTLCSCFARETAQRRASFYPLSVQTAIIWMDIEPGKIKLEEYQEEVQDHIRNSLKKLPIETAIALLSHFPEWLPYVDLISLVHDHR